MTKAECQILGRPEAEEMEEREGVLFVVECLCCAVSRFCSRAMSNLRRSWLPPGAGSDGLWRGCGAASRSRPQSDASQATSGLRNIQNRDRVDRVNCARRGLGEYLRSTSDSRRFLA
jgi:hypothetical protein